MLAAVVAVFEQTLGKGIKYARISGQLEAFYSQLKWRQI
jgi:hypothetical protein